MSRKTWRRCVKFLAASVNNLALKRDLSRRQWCTERVELGIRSVRGAEVDQTVSAMNGDVPGGSLETAWLAKLLFDRRLKSADERAESSAMVEAFYTSRRSEAKPR